MNINSNLYEDKALVMINSKDLIGLADHLQEFLQLTNSLEKKEEAFEKVIEAINPYYERYTNNKDKNSYITLSGKKAITCFLWLIWPHIGNSDERIKKLDNQCKTIRLMIRKPFSDRRLDIENIDILFQAAEAKQLYCSKLLKNKCLKVLLINNSHIEFNSFAVSQILSSGDLDDAVIMPYQSLASSCYQSLSFVHELGHILHCRIIQMNENVKSSPIASLLLMYADQY